MTFLKIYAIVSNSENSVYENKWDWKYYVGDLDDITQMNGIFYLVMGKPSF